MLLFRAAFAAAALFTLSIRYAVAAAGYDADALMLPPLPYAAMLISSSRRR